MEKIKIIFVGTDGIGGELLRALKKGFFDIPLVVTSPDRPAGRKLKLQPSAIKLVAEELGIEVFQPLDINAELSVRRLRNLNPDIILVMAYGQIVSQEILDIPKVACLNVHASLLPAYRGASPIQAAILNRDKKTGISLMRMERKMDAGPVYSQFELAVGYEDTALSLSDKLGALSAKEVPGAVQEVVSGLEAKPQDESGLSYCGKISKADGQIDWNQPAADIMARIRAFDPWPGTFTFFEGKRLKILSAIPKIEPATGEPGIATRGGIFCADGLIEPLEVKIEGGKAQSLHDFINGYPEFIGNHLK